MLQVTRSIATQASVAVPPDTPGSRRGIDGRYYSKYGIGQSVLGVPFYLMGTFAKHYSDPHLRDINLKADPITYFACLLGILSASGAAVLFYLSCMELGLSQSAGIFSALAFGTCTFVWFYARTFMTEPTSTFFLILTFYGLLRFTKDGRLVWLLVSGIGLSMAILVRVQNVVVLPAFALWLILDLWMSQRRDFKAALAAVTAWSLPTLASLAVLAAFNYVRFGSAMENGYMSGLGTRQMLPLIFSNPLYVGIYGFLLSPGKSIFWYAPILAPAFYGWKFLWKKYPHITLILGTLAGTYLLFYSKFSSWEGGGCWGPRYMVQMLPFLMIGLAALIDHGLGLIGWIVISTTAALSLFVQLTGVLVSYMPYVTVMIKSPEAFDRYLWDPAYSPVIVQAKDLLQHKYPYDLAYNAYPSEFLFRFQLAALLVSLVIFSSGIYLFRKGKNHQTERKLGVATALGK